MTTGSTASSDTEGADPQDPAETGETSRPPASEPDSAAPAPGAEVRAEGPAEEVRAEGPAEEVHDPARRAFFFQFGKQAVSAVGQVAGMADAVSRTSGGLAGELLGLAQPAAKPRPEFTRSGRGPDPLAGSSAPAADDVFRSAYRLAGDEVVLLDQRSIPEEMVEVSARRGSDVAYYLRLGVARGGPLMAQVAAYGLALTALERAQLPPAQRDHELRRTGDAIVAARPSVRLLAWSMARMRARLAELDETVPGTDVAIAMRTEADAIARDIGRWQATIAAAIGARLRQPEGRPLTVLVHGSQGALAGGLVGSGLAALAAWREAGRELRVFVTEGRPFMDGARLASWELRQAGIEHRVIPDAAAGWLFDRESVDVLLLSAEWMAVNGDVGALLGSRVMAAAARASGPAGGRPLVMVSGLTATRDPDTPDGASIPLELRPARELTAYLADVPIAASDALVPSGDVIPVEHVDLLVTEDGATSGGPP